MSVAVVPERLLVISVGIETYEYGSNLDLPGAGAAAARFASWALARGVPPENVWLADKLLPESPAVPPDLAEPDLPDLRNCKKIGTTRESFQNAFTRDIPMVRADALLIYWCGHGVLNENRERVLFTSDATEGDRRCLNVDNILRFLSSQAVPGLTEQLHIIDACANFVETLKWREKLPAGTLPVAPNRPVAQFSLYSASQGEIAQYNKSERRSDFSDTVFRWFSEQPIAGPLHMQELAAALFAHIRGYYQQRSTDNVSHQTPATRILQEPHVDRDELPVAGGLPVSESIQKILRPRDMTALQLRRAVRAIESLPADTPKLALLLNALLEDDDQASNDSDLSRRIALIFAERKTRSLSEALIKMPGSQGLAVDEVRTVLEHQEQISGIPQKLPKVTRQQMNESFWQATPKRSGAPPNDLDDALDRLSDYGPEVLDKFVRSLQDSSEYGPQAGVTLTTPLDTPRATSGGAGREQAHLVVEVRNGAAGAKFAWPREITGFRSVPGGREWLPHRIPVNGDPPALSDVQEAVYSLLTEIKNKYMSRFTLGFIMPREAFDELPEQWTHGAELVAETPVWKDHPTLLHILERFTVPRFRTAWDEVFREKESDQAALKGTMAWIEPELNLPERIRETLRRTNSPRACCGLSFLPGRAEGNLMQDPIIAALDCGAPFILWPWSEEGLGTWQQTRATVEDILATHNFDDLPAKIHEARLGGNMVRLIWDDPTLLPRTYLAGMG